MSRRVAGRLSRLALFVSAALAATGAMAQTAAPVPASAPAAEPESRLFAVAVRTGPRWDQARPRRP